MEVEYSLKVMSHKEKEQTGFVTDTVARLPQIAQGHGAPANVILFHHHFATDYRPV